MLLCVFKKKKNETFPSVLEEFAFPPAITSFPLQKVLYPKLLDNFLTHRKLHGVSGEVA